MNYANYIEQTISASIKVKQQILASPDLPGKVLDVAERCVDAYKMGGKILLAGNGGSAADAQHIAAELVARFEKERRGLPAIALTTDSSMLTAIGNDYGFEQLFARQVEANGKPGDVFIGISTSGNSANIIAASNKAKEMGITTVALCGEAGQLMQLVDVSINVPATNTARIQESHILIGHILCGIIEEAVFL